LKFQGERTGPLGGGAKSQGDAPAAGKSGGEKRLIRGPSKGGVRKRGGVKENGAGGPKKRATSPRKLRVVELQKKNVTQPRNQFCNTPRM